MRLTLGKKDYIRAHIVGNKINRKNLAEEGMEKEKIKFFTDITTSLCPTCGRRG